VPLRVLAPLVADGCGTSLLQWPLTARVQAQHTCVASHAHGTLGIKLECAGAGVLHNWLPAQVPSCPSLGAAGELEVQLTDLLHRQRELLLAAPVLPGGRFDPSLHPPRYPWRHAFLGALFTALAVALTWYVRASGPNK